MSDWSTSRLLPIWIVLGVSLVGWRILRVRSTAGDTVMLSANDRSRWCTIRALGDHGTFRIDQIIRERAPVSGRRVWHTIDRVRHRGWDGKEHDYSSKPPLLPVLLTGEYLVIKAATGASFATHPDFVMRVMLLLTNGGLLAVMWFVMGRRLERWGLAPWPTAVLMAVAVFGTFLTTFAVTLNNHLPAAVGCLLAAEGLCRIAEGDRRARWFFLSGAASAWTAANELPALSLVAASFLFLGLVSVPRTLRWFVPPVLIVAAAFFGTNWWAHGSWRPPYAHRDDGALLARFERDAVGPIEEGPLEDRWVRTLRGAAISVSSAARFERTGDVDRWSIFDPPSGRRWAVRVGDSTVSLFVWDDWYDYAGSYWRRPKGIDRGEPSRWVYAFNVLLGHHGLFSLTPFWLLSVIGIARSLRAESVSSRPMVSRPIAGLVLFLSLICILFFIFRPLADRNYGGMTTGFRWLFWLIPLWWLTAAPVVRDVASRRAGRWAVYAALAVSVFSATYGALNPWTQPWLYDCWKQLGWYWKQLGWL